MASRGAESTPVPTRTHAALVAVQVAFASLAVEGKVAMAPPYGVAPQALAMTRILGGAAVFALLGRLRPAPRRTVEAADKLRLAALSLFGIVVNQALFLLGLSRTSPMSATLLVATIPVFSALVATVAGRERLSIRTLLGIGLSVVGVSALSGFAVPAVGDLFVLLNAASYAVYLVFARGVLRRHGAVTVMAWVFGWGALLFAPIGMPALIAGVGSWSAPAAGLVAFVVLVPTVIAYSLNAWALEGANTTLVSTYIYLQPLVVAALAWAQLGQPPSGHALGGGALIFAGVGIVVLGGKRATPPRAPK